MFSVVFSSKNNIYTEGIKFRYLRFDSFFKVVKSLQMFDNQHIKIKTPIISKLTTGVFYKSTSNYFLAH